MVKVAEGAAGCLDPLETIVTPGKFQNLAFLPDGSVFLLSWQ